MLYIHAPRSLSLAEKKIYIPLHRVQFVQGFGNSYQMPLGRAICSNLDLQQ